MQHQPKGAAHAGEGMWSRAVKLLITVVLPAFFLYLFARNIDPAELKASLAGVGSGWWLLILAAFIQILHLILRAVRWRILLEPMKSKIGYYNLFSTISIGYMVTMLMPGRIGEVLRPILLAKREGISKSGSLATILLERLMDGVAVASFVAIYLIFFLGAPDSAERQAMAGIGKGWGVAAGGLVVLSFPMLWAMVHFRSRVAAVLEKLVSERSKLGRIIHQIFHGVADGFEVLRGGRALVAAWFYTYLIWSVIAFSIWFSLLAFGIDIKLQGSLIMLAALVFGIAIPTQGGVGTYEWFGQQALSRFFGIDPSAAGAAVLVMHVFAVGPIIIAGFLFLWREGLSFSGLKAAAQSREETPPGAASPGAAAEAAGGNP